METQRILMRSLAVVVIACIIWTITADAQEELPCCTKVSTREVTNPIISFKLQRQKLPSLRLNRTSSAVTGDNHG
ncbi:hypothetical protein Q8A67_024605 [Cirrhinus molitorella]|uniref:Uncharacterized protein n=1 Tax=Cirrhinus molitorella TaxID=172907 RepID=A0AA88TC13_9TELE|nr:hypothetical protein Q8A67_024605 [Cirrhinus molitorella]